MPLFKSANLLRSIIWLPSPLLQGAPSHHSNTSIRTDVPYSQADFPPSIEFLNANFEMGKKKSFGCKSFLQLLPLCQMQASTLISALLQKTWSEGISFLRVQGAEMNTQRHRPERILESQKEQDAKSSYTRLSSCLGFGCPAQHARSQFPDQGPIQWKYGVLTTGLPGKSRLNFVKVNWVYSAMEIKQHSDQCRREQIVFGRYVEIQL